MNGSRSKFTAVEALGPFKGKRLGGLYLTFEAAVLNLATGEFLKVTAQRTAGFGFSSIVRRHMELM